MEWENSWETEENLKELLSSTHLIQQFLKGNCEENNNNIVQAQDADQKTTLNGDGSDAVNSPTTKSTKIVSNNDNEDGNTDNKSNDEKPKEEEDEAMNEDDDEEENELTIDEVCYPL